MKLYRLERTQFLPVARETAWQFFSQPQNLPAITPDWLNFTLMEASAEKMAPGRVYAYRLTPFGGIRITWVSEITHVREPDFFVDEQRFGPYRFWHHRHTFKPRDDGTQMGDSVHYALGMGLIGHWVHRLVVAPRLAQIFDYRRETLKRIFGAAADAGRRGIN